MCTAIRFNDRLFGRTLDFEKSFGEELIVTPRGRMKIGQAENRYGMMGIGVMGAGMPLYFDGVNEWGLCSAALNFPNYAVYHGSGAKAGVSSAYLIPMMLGFCRSVSEVRDMLSNIVINYRQADDGTSATPLHWIVSDPCEALVVESVAEGLRVYDNPVGVLTNSPDFSYHLTRLSDFSYVSPKNPISKNQRLCSRGMGAIGLPGDFSSSSRFVRAAFLRENCRLSGEPGSVRDISLAFHIFDALSQPEGVVLSEKNEPVFTRYTAVVDMDMPSYYLTTAACRTIHRYSLSNSLCEGDKILTLPVFSEEIIVEK